MRSLAVARALEIRGVVGVADRARVGSGVPRRQRGRRLCNGCRRCRRLLWTWRLGVHETSCRDADPEADRDTDEETMPKCPMRVSASIHSYPRLSTYGADVRDPGLSRHPRVFEERNITSGLRYAVGVSTVPCVTTVQRSTGRHSAPDASGISLASPLAKYSYENQ